MKTLLIAGASGFIGKRLAKLFLSQGDHVIGLGTSETHPFSVEFPEFEWIRSDTTVKGDWQRHVPTADMILNLTGRNIFRPWTKKYKQAIYDSRILTTRNIVDAIDGTKPQRLLTTSAAGIYGDCKEDVLTETRQPGMGFLADVCTDWEKEGVMAQKKGVSVAVMRLGVVLGNGGALSLMIPAFKLFAGGPVGDGSQWFPWIHLEDLSGCVKFIMENDALEGVFNFTGPTQVRQKDFARALGRVLHRPAFFPAPSFIVKTVMGELGTALLQSQRVIPDHLLSSGYSFLFPDVDSALDDIFGN